MAKTALVTGASTGIGYELSKLFAKEGHNLILVARNLERLKEVAEELKKEHAVEVTVVAKDLSSATGGQELYDQLKGKSVDFLVNNAGYGGYGLFLDTDLKDELQMIQVNVTTLTLLTKLFARDMAKRGWGKILNVASTAAFQPGPLMAVYYATKSYVLLFSEAVNNECKAKGITVTALCPGATETNFAKRANTGNTKLFKAGVMDAATVAKSGFDAMMQGKAVVIPGLKPKILATAVRFLPRSLVTTLSRQAVEQA